jgi:hypothetical protein
VTDCGVCVGGSHGFDIEDYQRYFTTSKRNWACCECGRIIEAGTKYEKVSGVDSDEGTPVVFRTCCDCANIAEGLSCDRRVHSTLWDDLEEGYSRDDAGFAAFSEACVAKVKTVSAKSYLVERWRKWKGLA